MYIHAQVTPKAKEECVILKKEAYYIVHVREPAKDNRANERVRELLAKELHVPVGKVRIVNGHHSPSKLLSVAEG